MVPQFQPGICTLKSLNEAAQNVVSDEEEAPVPPRKELSFLATISGVQDMVKGLARASIPTRGPRYWQKVTDQELLVPPGADNLTTVGCIVIIVLLVLAVFK